MNTQKSALPSKSLNSDGLTATNVFPFLSHPPVSMVTVLEKQLKYPPSVSFCFEGFNKVKDSQQLYIYLIDTASTYDGTQLVVGIIKTVSDTDGK